MPSASVREEVSAALATAASAASSAATSESAELSAVATVAGSSGEEVEEGEDGSAACVGARHRTRKRKRRREHAVVHSDDDRSGTGVGTGREEGDSLHCDLATAPRWKRGVDDWETERSPVIVDAVGRQRMTSKQPHEHLSDGRKREKDGGETVLERKAAQELGRAGSEAEEQGSRVHRARRRAAWWLERLTPAEAVDEKQTGTAIGRDPVHLGRRGENMYCSTVRLARRRLCCGLLGGGDPAVLPGRAALMRRSDGPRIVPARTEQPLPPAGTVTRDQRRESPSIQAGHARQRNAAIGVAVNRLGKVGGSRNE